MRFERVEVWAGEICEQLGLDPKKVARLVIDLKPDAFPVITATIWDFEESFTSPLIPSLEGAEVVTRDKEPTRD